MLYCIREKHLEQSSLLILYLQSKMTLANVYEIYTFLAGKSRSYMFEME